MCKEGKVKRFCIHRLVASAYIPNPDNLPEVNHKDENKLNNNVNNLEWVSKSGNCLYGTRIKRITSTRTNREGGYNKGLRKPVFCVELNKRFDSAKSAGDELGISSSNIGNVCYGKRKTCGGYHWYFVE